MTTTQTAAAADKEKGPSPFLKGVAKTEGGYIPTVALWAHAEGSKFAGHGYVAGEKSVSIFFNHDKETGRKSISVKKYIDGVDGAEGSWKNIGFGNAMNSDKSGKPVYFDTVLFNIEGQTVSARVTKACDQALRDKIGFTSAQIERPKRVATEGEAAGETAVAAERPRG